MFLKDAGTTSAATMIRSEVKAIIQCRWSPCNNLAAGVTPSNPLAVLIQAGALTLEHDYIVLQNVTFEPGRRRALSAHSRKCVGEGRGEFGPEPPSWSQRPRISQTLALWVGFKAALNQKPRTGKTLHDWPLWRGYRAPRAKSPQFTPTSELSSIRSAGPWSQNGLHRGGIRTRLSRRSERVIRKRDGGAPLTGLMGTGRSEATVPA